MNRTIFILYMICATFQAVSTFGQSVVQHKDTIVTERLLPLGKGYFVREKELTLQREDVTYWIYTYHSLEDSCGHVIIDEANSYSFVTENLIQAANFEQLNEYYNIKTKKIFQRQLFVDIGIFDYHKGLAIYHDIWSSLVGLINDNAEIVVSARFKEIRMPQEGYSVFKSAQNGLWGVVRIKDDKIVQSPKYLAIRDAHDGFIEVKGKDRKWRRIRLNDR